MRNTALAQCATVKRAVLIIRIMPITDVKYIMMRPSDLENPSCYAC